MFTRFTFDDSIDTVPEFSELTLFACEEHHSLFRSVEAARAHARAEHGRSTAFYTDDSAESTATPDILIVPKVYLDEYVQEDFAGANLAACEFPILATDDAFAENELTIRHPFTGEKTETVTYYDASKNTIVDARCEDARTAESVLQTTNHPTTLLESEV